MMRAGDLNRLIVLSHPPGAEHERDAFNAPTEGALQALELLASFKAVSDAERFSGGEVAASLSGRFQVRWSPTVACINPTWSLSFEGRIYDIVGVKEIGYREAIEITASTRAE